MKRKLTPPMTSLGSGIVPKDREPRRPTGEPAPAPTRKPKILVVDADQAMRRLMGARLGAANYEVQSVGTAQAALDTCVRSRPNLVVTDLRLDDMGGIPFLKELKSRWPMLSVIVLTGHGTIAEAVEATQCGAFGYLVKPIEREELLGQVQRAIAASSFDPNDNDWRANIVSRSQLMEDRLSIANRAASCEVPVLLTGENGTGKELLARAVHAASPRREQPFVVLACKDRQRQLLDVELLGSDSQESALQRAQGGTLLLDEIGELPFDLQVALARAIAQYSLPSSNAQDANPSAARKNARLICTTSHDLQALVQSGSFFRDLFDQINILPIEIPPLGRRREDIPLLVSHFLEQATEVGGQKKIYSPQAIELLATTDWPGNVRQLFNLVKQHVALSHGNLMSKEFVQQSLGPQPPSMPAFDEARDQFSRDFLAANLQQAGGNVTKAARLAKRSRTDFYKLLERYRLQVDDFKEGGTHGPKREKKAGLPPFDDSHDS
ncbi:MAG: two-component system, NtrC family, response regulator GlrR [Gammaproteobacteria bacterium]|nr:two-component system, NtrC family, response regulator GlrR [Gammaproteobacteria bacterium]